jgi:hypothetical protein
MLATSSWLQGIHYSVHFDADIFERNIALPGDWFVTSAAEAAIAVKPRRSRETSCDRTLLAQVPMSFEQAHIENPSPIALLYWLTVAFPGWAGAILSAYTIFLFRFSALRIRREG